MKRRLLIAGLMVAAPALADAGDYVVPVPIPSMPAASPVAYGWTGGFIGVHLGYSTGDDTAAFTFFPSAIGAFGLPATTAVRSSGIVGGAQWGYNYQIGKLVIGTESDLSWVDRRGKVVSGGTALGGTPFSSTMMQKLDWLGTSRVRLGVTPLDRVLVYGTGGIAYGHVTNATNVTFPAITYSAAQSQMQVGWTAGAGVEYAITANLTAKLEYLYYDLGGATAVGFPTPPNPPFETHTHFDMTGHIVRAGLNYKIDGAPAWSVLPGMDRSPSSPKEFEVEFGTRYWFSTGRTAKDLFDFSGTAMVSRLTYSALSAYSAESFGRADHWSGAFVKGNLGTGRLTGGKLTDEDFPPFIVPQSATSSDLKDSSITYGSVDVGYSFLRGARYRVGAFAGYHYYHETLNAMGCTQTAGNPFVCVPSESNAIQGITNDGVWHSLRLGLDGDLLITDRLKLAIDAAWLPYTKLSSSDTHWLRLGQPGGFTGPVPENGVGHAGFQLEGILTYQVTEVFSVGAGARYWHMETVGNTEFEDHIVGGFGAPQPVNFRTDRYGAFVQGSFKF